MVNGERGETAARAVLGPLCPAVIAAAAWARSGREDVRSPPYRRRHRLQFDFPKPTATDTAKSERHEEQPLTEIRPDAQARLHIEPTVPALVARLREAAPSGIDITDATVDGGATYVRISAAFDVARWLAEDADAWWT